MYVASREAGLATVTNERWSSRQAWLGHPNGSCLRPASPIRGTTPDAPVRTGALHLDGCTGGEGRPHATHPTMSRDSDSEARTRANQAMDRYAEGETAAFSDLYDALAPRLFAFAMNLARHRAAAEDVVQQAFLQLHRARARWVPGAQVFSWAYAIAHNCFVDSTRRQRHERLADGEPSGADEVPSREALADEELDARRRLEAVLRRVQQLPEGQRLAFQLVELEGLSISEAAEVIGITTVNLKVRVHRAREVLKQAPELAGGAGATVTPSGSS